MTAPSSSSAMPVAVVGAGSWGTALAIHAASAGHDVVLWGHDVDNVARLREERENAAYLAGIVFPATLRVTAVPEEALRDARLVISAVPSRFLRDVWARLGSSVAPDAHLISATKGIEEGSGLRMTELLREVIPVSVRSLSALSGPSFARELAGGQPTAVALGCADAAAAEQLQVALSYGPLRVYRNSDLIGVEIAGALKNVIALAAGIAAGLSLGTNSSAALISRGLREISRLAVELGGRAETMMGLAGLGDLVLTCNGPLSRNRSIGVAIGRGQTLDEATRGMTMVAEGIATTRSVRQIARRHGVEMPITEQVYQVLYGGTPARQAIDELLARTLVEEWG